MKIKIFYGIIITVLVILFFSFYWWQLRPAKIRTACVAIAMHNSDVALWSWIEYGVNHKYGVAQEYEGCLHLKGLN